MLSQLSYVPVPAYSSMLPKHAKRLSGHPAASRRHSGTYLP